MVNMKKLFILLVLFMNGFVVLAQQPQTPFEMAMILEHDLAAGVGILMPDPNMPYIGYQGILPLPDADPAGFPQTFLNGLTSATEYGVTVYPVTLCVDDGTGVTAFYNGADVAFWQEAPAGTYFANWLQQLHGAVSPQMAALLRPSHVVALWVFIAEQDIAAYHEARLASLRPSGTGTPPAPANVPVLNVTAFVPAPDTYAFASAWNSTAYFPGSLMNVLFTPDLRTPTWTVVQTVPVANTGPRTAFFEVPRAALPPYIPPPSAHDPNCTPVTNIVVSPLDPLVSYTNTVCNCTLPTQKPAGFFRLDIKETGSGLPPAWWRVLHGLAPYDSWEDAVDFTGDGNANSTKFGLGINPVAPPNAASGATIQYTYDADDRLNAAFIGPKGDAAVRNLSPAGNPKTQQERTAP